MPKFLDRFSERHRLAFGWFLVIAGAILGPVPFIQGWVLGIPGLIILSERYHWARRLLAWAKKKAGWNNRKGNTTNGEHPSGDEGRRKVAGDQ